MGPKKRLRRLSPEIEAQFPNLASSEYEITSEATPDYNCIAFAAGDTGRWWDSVAEYYYWPSGAIRERGIRALVSAYETLGFCRCETGVPEAGYEKVALYADRDGNWTHAARLLRNGSWSSKLGECEDIRHAEVEALEDSQYGFVVEFMKRRIQSEL